MRASFSKIPADVLSRQDSGPTLSDLLCRDGGKQGRCDNENVVDSPHALQQGELPPESICDVLGLLEQRGPSDRKRRVQNDETAVGTKLPEPLRSLIHLAYRIRMLSCSCGYACLSLHLTGSRA